MAPTRKLEYYYNLYLHRRRKVASIAFYILMLELRQRIVNRNIWVHHWIARREVKGAYINLFLELRMEDPAKFRSLRMTHEMFDWLVSKVSPLIKKQDTHLRQSISPDKRLAVTLRHLATGKTQESLSLLFRIDQSTISGIIKETCKALYTVLKDTYLKFPSTKKEWKNVAAEYGDKWNFSNCIDAMDGKHIVISPPLQSGSLYYNYKDSFSIVLLAVVDPQLRFIYADVDTNGRISDKGVWNKCSLKRHLEENAIDIPFPAPLPDIQTPFPFVIVGDEGFVLTNKILILYSKEQLKNKKDRRIFNYRLSRARRCSENAFGVMANRFQIFRSPMRYDPDDVRNIVMSILCLHNLLRSDTLGRILYTPPDMIDYEDEMAGCIKPGKWRQEADSEGFLPLGNLGGNRHANNALKLRDEWCFYFNNAGAVPWQERMISLG